MPDHQATRNRTTQPLEPEQVPLPRAIILHGKEDKPQTVGFPALHRTKPKIARFTTPLRAQCMSVDGVWCTDCLVLSVCDTGAELQVTRPGDLMQFYLVFTSSLTPVFRRCERTRTWGDKIEVAFQRKQPDYLLKPGLDA